MACAQVAALLSEEGSLWRRSVHRVVGGWLLRRLGLGQDWLAPARLDYVYDDDLGNLPIHYIALGTPVSMCGRPPYSFSAYAVPQCMHEHDSQHWSRALVAITQRSACP